MKNTSKLSKLQKTLAINAGFSGLSGLVMSLASQPLARFMGIQEPIQLALVGINLILFSGFLIWLVRQPSTPRALAWSVVAGDLAWVVLSALGLATLPHQLSTGGIFLVLDVASIVAGFALAQIFYLTRPSLAKAKSQ